MKLTQFEQGFFECALWSSVDDNEDHLDANYSIEDIDESTILKLREQCDQFIEKAGAMLDDIDDSQAGHDFWLTRNHHGAGFWDRGLGEVGEKLTALSHSFGEIDLYVGDDGKVYS